MTLYHYEVVPTEGRKVFPLDMLCLNMCYPAHMDDFRMMLNAAGPNGIELEDDELGIHLQSHMSPAGSQWEARGWLVILTRETEEGE